MPGQARTIPVIKREPQSHKTGSKPTITQSVSTKKNKSTSATPALIQSNGDDGDKELPASQLAFSDVHQAVIANAGKKRSLLPQRTIPSAPASPTKSSAHDGAQAETNISSASAKRVTETGNKDVAAEAGSSRLPSTDHSRRSSPNKSAIPVVEMQKPESLRRVDDLKPSLGRQTTAEQPSGLSRHQSLRNPGDRQPSKGGGARSHNRHHSTIVTPNLTANTLPQPRTHITGSQSSNTNRNSISKIPGSRMSSTSSRSASTKRISSTQSQNSNIHEDSNRPARAPTQASRIASSITAPNRKLSSNIKGSTDGQKPAEPAKRVNPVSTTTSQQTALRKSSKLSRPTSSASETVEPSTNISPPSTETVRLQAELLQLHLLHSSSAAVFSQWRQSAKQALHDKYNRVTAAHEAMRDKERQVQQRSNIATLQEWEAEAAKSRPDMDFTRSVQILSKILEELPGLIDSGGQHATLVDGFEKWLSWVSEIWQDRDESSSKPRWDFVEAMGDSWKAENTALTRRLSLMSRDLAKITPPREDSSIALVLGTCRALVDGALDELKTMHDTERAVMERERLWVDEQLSLISQDTARGSDVVATTGSKRPQRRPFP